MEDTVCCQYLEVLSLTWEKYYIIATQTSQLWLISRRVGFRRVDQVKEVKDELFSSLRDHWQARKTSVFETTGKWQNTAFDYLKPSILLK